MKKLIYVALSIVTLGIIAYFLVRNTKVYKEYKKKFDETKLGKKVEEGENILKESIQQTADTIKKVIEPNK